MPEPPDLELLPPIPGHAHTLDIYGRPTCGCTIAPARRATIETAADARAFLMMLELAKPGDQIVTNTAQFWNRFAKSLRLLTGG